MSNVIAMDHPSLKPDNSILFKSSFLRTVKYKNFVLPKFLCIIVFLKRAIMIQKRDREEREKRKEKKGVALNTGTHMGV
jgi:hypothetical protein